MISSKVTLLLLPMVFLALVSAQAQDQTQDLSLSCEDAKTKNNWSEEQFQDCVKLRQAVGDIASGLGKAAVGFATWIIVIIVISILCCCGIPIGITIWCCCCKDKRGNGGNV